MNRWVVMTAICCSLFKCGVAQQSQSGGLPDAPSASAQSQPAQTQANPVQSGVAFLEVLEQKSRVFPDIATNSGRMDSWQKFKLAANNSIAASTIGAALVGSAFDQAINSPEGYGQGAEGYGKRFGASMARAASNNMFGTFLIASVSHQDPRFYIKSNLSFKQSLKYAAVRLVRARSDSGEQVTDYAGLLGPLAGESLANTYYPEGSRGASGIFTRYASDQGWRFAGYMVRQYWPRISRRLKLVPAEDTPAKSSNKP
jgi:hypothetical protein